MRAGQLAHFEAVGRRDPENDEPLKTDAIFSIASMTKAMDLGRPSWQLVEEGRILLGDPVATYLPPLAVLRVADGKGGTRAPKSLPTVQDLLRHASGLTYQNRGDTYAHAAYPGSSVVAAEKLTKDATIAALARAPLLFDPGTNWEYGFSTDVLGFIVEAVSGKRLSHFWPSACGGRSGCLTPASCCPPTSAIAMRVRLPRTARLTGAVNVAILPRRRQAADLGQRAVAAPVSTAADYLRFAEALRLGGTLGSAQILGRGTVTLMTCDHLPSELGNRIADSMDPAAMGYGFGLGFAVRRQNGIAATGRQRRRFLLVGRLWHLFLGRPQRGINGGLYGCGAAASFASGTGRCCAIWVYQALT